jgi:hypothetical protein
MSIEQATIYGSDKLGTDIAVLGSIAMSNCMLSALLAKDMRSNLTTLLPSGKIEEVRQMLALRASRRTNHG